MRIGAERFKRLNGWTAITAVGLAIVAGAAGVVAGVAARQHTYTVQQLTAHWAAPYDLVVFPPGHRQPASALVNPNSLDSGVGGISLAQYHRIARLPGVAVAAPLAPLGYLPMTVGTATLASATPAGGVYRLTTRAVNRGLPAGEPSVGYGYVGAGSGSGPSYSASSVSVGPELLIMAVNPTAEAHLMGLSHAVVAGRYFTAADSQVSVAPSGPGAPSSGPSAAYQVPVLLTTVAPAAGSVVATLQHLTLPPKLRHDGYALVGHVFQSGHPGVLAALPGSVVGHLTISNTRAWSNFLRAAQGLSTLNSLHGYPFATGYRPLLNEPLSMASAARYQRVPSPIPSRWPVALRVAPAPSQASGWGYLGEPFRTVREGPAVNITLKPIGYYSPRRLKVSDDPLTHLPLVGYRPETGHLVLSLAGRAENPAPIVKPDGSPAGLWTAPPEALTPLGAVAPLLGSKPISSIRIRVAGVPALGAGGAARLRQVAQEITRATHLPVTVVRGASPQEVLLHPGALAPFAREGWIATDWVRLGTSVEILRQATLNQAVTLGPILAAAALFAGITAWLGLEASRRRWAVTIAVGVPPRVVLARLLGAAGAQGLVVAGAALGTALVVGGPPALPLGLPVGLGAGFVAALAMVPAARAVARQDPLAGLRPDPPAALRRVTLGRAVGLGLGLAAASWRRLTVAMAALVVPAGVLYAVGLVQWAWHNTLHVTLLGQYLLVRGGALMTLAVVVCAVLAGAAAAAVAVSGVAARQRTWALGAALGWTRGVALAAILAEAGLVGLAAGAVGAGLAALVLSPLFGVPAVAWLGGATVLGLMAVSLLASLPAVWAVGRQDPVAIWKRAAAG